MFVYDGWNLVEEITAESGGGPESKFYVWGLDLSQSIQGAGGIGGLIATFDGGSTYYFCYDGNGNVGQLVDSSDGSIASHMEYDPFGNIIEMDGDYSDRNAFRFSTKYSDVESELVYYGYRYYWPIFGRWLNRDPIGEIGDLNLYFFIANNPIDLWEILGLDFIAVADRAVSNTLGLFYHYSLQYWKCTCDPELRKELEVSEFLKIYKSAKKEASVELLRDNSGWKVWAKTKGMFSNKTTWKVTSISISVIHYTDSSDKLAVIFKDITNQKGVESKWKLIEQNAKKYDYAEQSPFNGAFTNWPNSKYQFPGDKPFNNSNTFIRQMVSEAGLQMFEMNGSHPGENNPSSIPNIYRGVPYK